MVKRKYKRDKVISGPVKKQQVRYIYVVFLLGLVVGVVAGYLFAGLDDNPSAVVLASNINSTNAKPTDISSVFSIEQLLNLSDEELSRVDIALMNLICAQGLKGSENLDIDKCLSILDEWAARIKADTQARLPAYHANPAKYDNSLNLFKLGKIKGQCLNRGGREIIQGRVRSF